MSRSPIPDAVLIQDPTLLHQVDLFGGLADDGYILLNSERGFDELGMGDFIARFRPERVRTMPATAIAREHLGRPLPNSVLLGGFAGLCDVVELDAVTQALRDRFPGKLGDMNTAAATAACEFVRESLAGRRGHRCLRGQRRGRPCLSSSRARRRLPERSACAGPR